MFYAKKVDIRSKKAMVDFLTGHFRCSMMNGWNGAISYANNIKLHRVGLNSQQQIKDEIRYPIDDFTSETRGGYTITVNGRLDVYLVLCESVYEMTKLKSYCRTCGQQNFKSVHAPARLADHAFIEEFVFRNGGVRLDTAYLEEAAIAAIKLPEQEKVFIIRAAKKACKEETMGNKCGLCGAEGDSGRVNYEEPPKRLSVHHGISIDQNENFAKWSLSQLRDRVDLVRRFDQVCDNIRSNFINFLDNCEAVEEVVMIPKTVKRIEYRHAA